MKKTLLALVSALGIAATSPVAWAGKDLDAVKQRDTLICGVAPGTAGFALPGSDGQWSGFDVDLCRAIAIAILGTPEKTRYVPLSDQVRFATLSAGEVDVLTRTATWTLQRDASLGLDWTGVNFYDGLALLVRKDLGVKSAKELDGATICLPQGGTGEAHFRSYYEGLEKTFTPIAFESQAELVSAFFAGRCDALGYDSSGLAGFRATRAPKPDDYVILPERIAKSPLGPVVREGDARFADIVRWTLFALVTAEELGVTSKNIDSPEIRDTKNPTIRQLLGFTPGNGKALGLRESWAYDIIKHLGNYGELFERHLGKDTVLGLERGLNDLYTRGGLQYAPPL
ncbi:amino acid ABC transporter substrate-binding protein [Corticibacter populi]|uniref:Amino acid ABC transporter substrate-binding protein n=1 Tax=Corticibacter populi TaxID=1550736 RepID=A0A3M6R0S9_9BURK|nr:amino acid ABC transporter substrate-binding protein [Corticibacter populi]